MFKTYFGVGMDKKNHLLFSSTDRKELNTKNNKIQLIEHTSVYAKKVFFLLESFIKLKIKL